VITSSCQSFTHTVSSQATRIWLHNIWVHFDRSLEITEKVVLVPGLFGNRSDSWTDDFLTDKMQRYWDWAQTDPRVAGFNGYHYDTRTIYPECTHSKE